MSDYLFQTFTIVAHPHKKPKHKLLKWLLLKYIIVAVNILIVQNSPYIKRVLRIAHRIASSQQLFTSYYLPQLVVLYLLYYLTFNRLIRFTTHPVIFHQVQLVLLALFTDLLQNLTNTWILILTVPDFIDLRTYHIPFLNLLFSKIFFMFQLNIIFNIMKISSLPLTLSLCLIHTLYIFIIIFYNYFVLIIKLVLSLIVLHCLLLLLLVLNIIFHLFVLLIIHLLLNDELKILSQHFPSPISSVYFLYRCSY